MQYTVVLSVVSAGDLAEKVSSYILDGWKPLGGVAITSHEFGEFEESATLIWAQAMVKE